jgi:hypothetical protein
MMAAAQKFETITMPDAGIGSFLTTNVDEFDDNVLMFGREAGINSIKSVADRMASMGRNGDNYIVHATEKEMIVPQDVAENNPELMNQLKQAIAADGTDPERYVVGSDRNSINPYTGQPEFFRILKKIAKGIKKVFKKAAKIILPVAAVALTGGLGGAGLFGMGAAGTAAVASGVGSLLQGESFKDALKSAAIAGLGTGFLGGLSGGLQAMGTTGGTFSSGFASGAAGTLPAGYRAGAEKLLSFGKSGAAAPAATPATAMENAAKVSEIMAANPNISSEIAYKMVADQAAQTAAGAAAKGSFLKTAFKYGLPALGIASATGMFDPIPASEIEIEGFDEGDTSEVRLAENPDKYSVGVPDTASPGYIAPSQAIYSGQPLTTASYLPSQGTYNPIVPSATYASLTPSGAGTNTGTIVPSSGGVGTYVPPAPVVIPGYDPGVTGMRPAPLYGVDAQGNPIYTPYQEPIRPASYVEPEVQMAAAGGPMTMSREGQRNMALDQFPRRTGQIQGPGTETSDDIPAMLSDGEFVMTARAVRGAGNGSREQGFRKMYDIMRAFEGGAVA